MHTFKEFQKTHLNSPVPHKTTTARLVECFHKSGCDDDTLRLCDFRITLHFTMMTAT